MANLGVGSARRLHANVMGGPTSGDGADLIGSDLPQARASARDNADLEVRRRRNKGSPKVDKLAVDSSCKSDRPSAFQELTDAEQATLRRWARRRTSPHRLVIRSRIVLLVTEGVSPGRIAAKLQVSPATVRLWTQRFSDGGLAALAIDAPGRGRRPGTSLAVTIAVLEATRSIARHQVTVRHVAAQAGTSPSTVWRVWRRLGVGPDSSSDAIKRVLRNVISGTA